MKKKDTQSQKAKSIKELKGQTSNLRQKLIETEMAVVIGKEKNLKKAKNLKREIARTLTLIREKEILENKIK
jgi:ribosomal protein L29